MNWEIIISSVSLLLSAITFVFSFFVLYHKEIMSLSKELGNLSERITGLEKEMKPALELTRNLWRGMSKRVADKVLSTSNPVSKEKIRELLNKLGEGTLTPAEAEELKPVLESALENAKKAEDYSFIADLTILLAILEGKIDRLVYVRDRGRGEEKVTVEKRAK